MTWRKQVVGEIKEIKFRKADATHKQQGARLYLCAKNKR